jgi:hypothetical protein
MIEIRDERTRFEAADDERQGPLSCGQRYIWDIISALVPNDEHLNLREVIELPRGSTVDSVVFAVRSAIEYHEALRTRYFLGDDNEPVQQVLGRGQFSVTLLDAEGNRGRVTAERASGSIAERRFDLATDFHLRSVVVRTGGRPSHLVLVLSHMACDIWAVNVLKSQIRRLVVGEKPQDVFPARSWHPLDQAAYEVSEEGLGKAARSTDLLRSRLSQIPDSLFGEERFEAQPERYWEGLLKSSVAASSAHVLAQRMRVNASSVMTAAAAKALGQVSGVRCFGFAMRTFNRYRRHTRESVGHYSQDIPMLVSDLDRPFEEIAKQTQSDMGAMLRCPYYWPPELQRMKAEIGRARGTGIEIEAAVNNNIAFGEGRPSSGHGRVLPNGGSPFVWTMRRGEEAIKYLFHSYPDRLKLLADTAYMPPNAIEEYLRRVESILASEAGI